MQQAEYNLSSFINSTLLLKSQEKQTNKKTEFISAIIQSLSQWQTKIINNSDLVLPSLYIIQQVTKQMGKRQLFCRDWKLYRTLIIAMLVHRTKCFSFTKILKIKNFILHFFTKHRNLFASSSWSTEIFCLRQHRRWQMMSTFDPDSLTRRNY